MKAKILVTILALTMFFGLAAAADPDVNITVDGVSVQDINATLFYPNQGTDLTLSIQVMDGDSPTDANISVGLLCAGVFYQVTDTNSASLCSLKPFGDVNIACSYTIDASALSVLPAASTATTMTGVDANCSVGVQVLDITSTDVGDFNISGGIYADFNACDTDYEVGNDTVTLTRVCTGFGTDTNGGTESTVYSKNRQKTGCAVNETPYIDPFGLSFGEFTVCYKSFDGLGNNETKKSFVHIADSNAYNLALLTELALAALLIFVLVGAFLVRELNPMLMVGLVIAAITMAISILIFAVVL